MRARGVPARVRLTPPRAQMTARLTEQQRLLEQLPHIEAERNVYFDKLRARHSLPRPRRRPKCDLESRLNRANY
jgi:hypothetical protein